MSSSYIFLFTAKQDFCKVFVLEQEYHFGYSFTLLLRHLKRSQKKLSRKRLSL